MENKILSAKEIIEETVNYYSEDVGRRANNLGGYFYRTEDGRMCGVGRCMNEYADFDFGDFVGNYDETYNLENHLQDQYKGHEIEFWKFIQNLHDTSEYWDSNGITLDGKMFVEELLEEYA